MTTDQLIGMLGIRDLCPSNSHPFSASSSPKDIRTQYSKLGFQAALHWCLQKAVDDTLLINSRQQTQALKERGSTYRPKYEQVGTKAHVIGMFCTNLRRELSSILDFCQHIEPQAVSQVQQFHEPRNWEDVGVPKKWASLRITLGAGDHEINLPTIRRLLSTQIRDFDQFLVDHRSLLQPFNSNPPTQVTPMMKPTDSTRIPVTEDPTSDQGIKEGLKVMGSSLDAMRILLTQAESPTLAIQQTHVKVDKALEAR